MMSVESRGLRGVSSVFGVGLFEWVGGSWVMDIPVGWPAHHSRGEHYET